MTPWNSDLAHRLDQAGVVPFRHSFHGLEVCLITSMSGRWGFPKGIIDPGDTFPETSIKEALEEAGLRGRLVGEPLGCYDVFKYGRMNTVVVSAMEVTQCDDTWDEDHLRERLWVTPDEARQLLCRPWLRSCLDAAVARIEHSLAELSEVDFRLCESEAAV